MEFEFRAWDTAIHKDGVMIAWEELKKYSCESVFLPLREVTLMQYTGLKDKNGAKIYEGDICSVEFRDTTKENLFVIWSGEIAGFHFADGCGGFWRVTATPIEIIGNKFENPELLTKG